MKDKSCVPEILYQHHPEVTRKLQNLRKLVGNTPLLQINFTWQNEARRIFAKAESFNLTGSIKDRMAWYILQNAYSHKLIQPGDKIAEATSGNTGISFSAIGRALGHPVVIYMPDWMSSERVALIHSFGAEIVPVSREEGGFLGSIYRAQHLALDEEHIFLPEQFANEANVEAHEKTTGPEIWWQLQSVGLQPDAFVAGVGTGGTIMGVGRYLREQSQKVKIHPVEPTESPTLSEGHKVGQHRIQGISDEFIPAIVHLDKLNEVIDINDGDAILVAQKLASELGLAVGISSGCNFLAALKAQNCLGSEAIVTTVFPDSNKKYLSTDLCRREQPRPDYLTPQISFQSYYVIERPPADFALFCN